MKLSDTPIILRTIEKGGGWTDDPNYPLIQDLTGAQTIAIPRDMSSVHMQLIFLDALDAVVAGTASCTSFYFKTTPANAAGSVVFGSVEKAGVASGQTMEEAVQACEGFGLRVRTIASATATKLQVWISGFANERVGG